MSPIISELLRITVRPDFELESPQFAKLREAVVKIGVKEQYYGVHTDDPSDLLWVIQWPGDMNPAEYKGTVDGPDGSKDFRESVKALDTNSKPNTWYLPFEDASLPRPALTAPLCQLCCLHVSSAVELPVSNTIADSLHKTFTDCYHAPGFTGGYWSTATNDNKMNYYYLGWETREHHDAYSKTALFDLEIDKLMPHMDGGGTHYAKMIQELS